MHDADRPFRLRRGDLDLRAGADLRADDRVPGRSVEHRDVLGADVQHDPLAGKQRCVGAQGDRLRGAAVGMQGQDAVRQGDDPAAQQRAAVGAEQRRRRHGRRRPVQLVGLPDLMDRAVEHGGDPVAERHRLRDVVGDVERGGADAAMEMLEFRAELRAQLGIDVGQRLVEQQHVRLPDQRAGDRHALLLAAGQLARVALLQPGQLHDVERLPDRRADPAPAHAPGAQRKRDVLRHRHVRVERI